MSTQWIRPDHLHDAARISSATEEEGLTIGVPEAAAGNSGTLVLRESGVPSEALDLDVLLQTGGNPVGYSLDDSGSGSGAAAVWKKTSDTSSQYRGYVDTIYLAKVISPLAYAAIRRWPSTPRELPNGNLGYILSGASTNTFVMITTALVVNSTTIVAGSAVTNGSDFVVLPSGRLVALVQESITVAPSGYANSWWASYYSDDNGSTWSLLNHLAVESGTDYIVSMEYIDDVIVAVVSRSPTAGAIIPQVWTSRDGGTTWANTGSHSSQPRGLRTCTTSNGRVLVSYRSTLTAWTDVVIPGGGFGSGATGVIGNNDELTAIAKRDDGTIWLFSANVSASNAADLRVAVSLDNGDSFTEAAGSQDILNLHDTPAANPIDALSAGVWQGKVVTLISTRADSGSDNNHYVLVWGGWESVTENRSAIASAGQPYEHTYLPLDYPDALGWTRTNVGAGATVLNRQVLNITAIAGTNSYFSASGTFWTGSAGDTKRLRFRVRVNSDGSTADDRSILIFAVSDGANWQMVKLRFDTAGFVVIDGAGNTLATVNLTMTSWTDFLIGYAHDYDAVPTGRVSIWTKQDADVLWTNQLSAGVVAEAVGAANLLRFGGQDAGAVDWDILLLEAADDDSGGMADGFTNPDDLAGRPLTASEDYYVLSGLHLGGRHGWGIPGDSYAVSTSYSYAKENIWQELRPSRHCRSTQDNISWDVVFDAGANNVWSVQTATLFGTNIRQATFQMNATDAWGAPSVSQTMDIVVATGTVGAGNRGPGYVGPASSPSWRPGQFKSDGDAHRWFLEVAGNVYEITDNDTTRIFVEDVDFSAVAGTFYIFGDRAGKDLGSVNRYRFIRVLYPSQPTSDGYYRLGSMIAEVPFEPAVSYSEDFVDRTEPRVEVIETLEGYRAAARLGPRRLSIAVQWGPLNRMHSTISDLERQIHDFYTALEGSKTPFAFWRDSTDISTLGLYRLAGVYSSPNLKGELTTALARVDQLVLEEEL